MELEELQYCLAKQTNSIESINTNYGTIELDDEMKKAVKVTLERVLKRKIAKITK